MKSMLQAVVLGLTTLAFTGMGFAQAKPATPATPATPAAPATDKKAETKSAKAKSTRVTGEVTAVDPKAGTLTVKTKDKELNLTADTKSAKNSLAKVKVGDQVRVSYTEKDGKMLASSIAGVKGTSKKSDTGMEKSKSMDKPEKKADEKKSTTK